MSTDLVPATDWTAELDRLADPGEFVIASVDRAKHWLTEALDHGDIARIVEIKSQADAVRTYVMAKQLGKDAELAASEIVRRAERGIGLAIRKGQDSGRIRRQGQGGGNSVPPGANQPRSDKSLLSPEDFATNTELSGNDAGIYHMTDGVPDDEFERAITAAKTERNLSRANVVRKVKKEEKPVSAPDRVPIASAAAQRRAFTGACNTLSGVAHGLRQIDGIHPDITCEEAAEWVDGLSEARLAIERAIKRLKERANSVPQA